MLGITESISNRRTDKMKADQVRLHNVIIEYVLK